MAYQYIRGAISCSATTSYTGSFVKIQALGDAGDVECVLDRVEWGKHTDPIENATTVISSSAIEIPAGTSIDGPILKFKTGTNGAGKGFLAYFNTKG